MCHILIVEDEPRLAAFIEKGLQNKGFKTSVATDGQQALFMAQNETFDLLLLDLGLPIMDGWTVIERLRNQGNQVPVIVVTARDPRESRNIGQRFNIEGYISKPFRFQDLLKQVESYLDNR
ncbi:MAG: response regulator [Cyanobacteria bacterium P01_G01_bin.49]